MHFKYTRAFLIIYELWQLGVIAENQLALELILVALIINAKPVLL